MVKLPPFFTQIPEPSYPVVFPHPSPLSSHLLPLYLAVPVGPASFSRFSNVTSCHRAFVEVFILVFESGVGIHEPSPASFLALIRLLFRTLAPSAFILRLSHSSAEPFHCAAPALPDTLLANVFSRLPLTNDLASCACVCLQWRDLLSPVSNRHCLYMFSVLYTHNGFIIL